MVKRGEHTAARGVRFQLVDAAHTAAISVTRMALGRL